MNAQLLIMKGLVSEMAPTDQQAVKEISERIRAIIEQDKEHGVIALSLVALELQDA